jgi:hypothetical protein
MDFSTALLALKDGHRIARTGWNGAGQWLILVPGSNVELRPGTPYHTALNSKISGQKSAQIDAHIDMHTASGSMQPGWIASQKDLLSADWELV